MKTLEKTDLLNMQDFFFLLSKKINDAWSPGILEWMLLKILVIFCCSVELAFT